MQGSGKVPDDPEDDDDDDQEELAPGVTGVAEGRNVEDDEYEYEEESYSGGRRGKRGNDEAPNRASSGFAGGSVRRGVSLKRRLFEDGKEDNPGSVRGVPDISASGPQTKRNRIVFYFSSNWCTSRWKVCRF